MTATVGPANEVDAASLVGLAAAPAGTDDGLLQLLLEVVANRDNSSDMLQSLMAGAVSGSAGAAPRLFATRRRHFRQVAAKSPGLLQEQALAKMTGVGHLPGRRLDAR